MKWEIVIGLETHAQLSTKSKIFSGASTAFGAAPNTQACAVDIALPGVLPVMNREAVEKAVRFGLAVGSNINRRSIFARKNYFYPDLPKGYQISQYETPIVQGGSVSIFVDGKEKTVQLTRAHLEEDAGKSLHEGFHDFTAIDLNRAGTPLLEIVSEPDMRSAEEAVAYAKTLHALVRWIGICDGNMQEGSFRCDANVSVRPEGSDKLGTRREIKNLNSFRFLQQAIEYEAKWQIETLEGGGRIEQATVLFNSDTGETRAMRTKEDAHDYRYFPDPDLLPLVISEEWIAKITESVVAVGTPQVRKNEYIGSYGLTSNDAWQLVKSRETAEYFDKMVSRLGKNEAKLCANWMNGELASALNRDGIDITQSRISSTQLADLLVRLRDGTLSVNMAKEVFDAMWVGAVPFIPQDWPNPPARRQIPQSDIPPNLLLSTLSVDEIIEKRGLKQISDAGAIEKIVDEVLARNAKQVQDYKSGKNKAFNSLVGQVMKATQGKANPQQVNETLKRKLSS